MMARTVNKHLTSEQQEEIASLSEQELHTFEPKEHPAVQKVDARIAALQSDVQRTQQEAAKRDTARKKLKEAKKAHALGDAPESDVEAARERLKELRTREDADAEGTDVEAAREAIEELKKRRETALRVVQKFYRNRCTEVYGALVSECEQPLRRLLDIRERIHKLDATYKRRGGKVRGGTTLKYDDESGDKLPPFPIPEPGDHHPRNRPIMLSTLKGWLRDWGTE
jgi:uncharacterized small protein (DUF1192 family)